MKRYFISFCVIISIVSIMFVGCGGSKSGGGRKQIKIFETSGGVVYNMPINQSGIVFADSILEIGNEYILFVPNDEAVLPYIDVALFDESGNRQPDIVNLTIDGDQCIDLTKMSDNPAGGKSGQLIGIGNGGKCQLIATAGEITRSINILVYDSCSVNDVNMDFRIPQKDRANTRAESTIYGDTTLPLTPVKITHGSYKVTDCNQINWRTELKNVARVDVNKFDNGETQPNNILDPHNPAIYIAKTPDDGYVKIIAIGSSIIWEYTQTNSFK